MIDFSIHPDWYSEVIEEAHRQKCPEAFVIHKEIQRLLGVIDNLTSENDRLKDALEKAMRSESRRTVKNALKRKG